MSDLSKSINTLTLIFFGSTRLNEISPFSPPEYITDPIAITISQSIFYIRSIDSGNTSKISSSFRVKFLSHRNKVKVINDLVSSYNTLYSKEILHQLMFCYYTAFKSTPNLLNIDYSPFIDINFFPNESLVQILSVGIRFASRLCFSIEKTDIDPYIVYTSISELILPLGIKHIFVCDDEHDSKIDLIIWTSYCSLYDILHLISYFTCSILENKLKIITYLFTNYDNADADFLNIWTKEVSEIPINLWEYHQHYPYISAVIKQLLKVSCFNINSGLNILNKGIKSNIERFSLTYYQLLFFFCDEHLRRNSITFNDCIIPQDLAKGFKNSFYGKISVNKMNKFINLSDDAKNNTTLLTYMRCGFSDTIDKMMHWFTYLFMTKDIPHKFPALYLYGAPSIGKTKFIQHLLSYYSLTKTHLNYSKDNTNFNLDADVLVLDEFGKSNMDHIASFINSLISGETDVALNAKYKRDIIILNRTPVIFISNLPPPIYTTPGLSARLCVVNLERMGNNVSDILTFNHTVFEDTIAFLATQSIDIIKTNIFPNSNLVYKTNFQLLPYSDAMVALESRNLKNNLPGSVSRPSFGKGGVKAIRLSLDDYVSKPKKNNIKDTVSSLSDSIVSSFSDFDPRLPANNNFLNKKRYNN